MTSCWPLPVIRKGIDRRWVEAYAAQQLADVLARLVLGHPLARLRPSHRAFFNSYAEQTIARAVEHYASCRSETSTPTTTTNTTAPIGHGPCPSRDT